ncbi:MAG: ATP-binding protein [Azoarcus sp.]|nr:ATP-binding protein [Azoarcus sp.]
MLVEVSVANFRSIADRQTLSLVASHDAAHLERNAAMPVGGDKGPRLLRSAVIYGPNAAGKSNVLRALETFRQWVLRSSGLAFPPPSGIPDNPCPPLTPFLLGQSDDDPCEFDIVLDLEGVRYHYGLAARRERVYREWLVSYPKGRPQRWFERGYQPGTQRYEWWFGPAFRGERKQRQAWQNSTRDDALFLSTAVQLNNEQLRPLHDWFRDGLIVLLSGIRWNPGLSLDMLRDDDARSRLMAFMQAADVGIDRLELREEEGKASLQGQNVPGRLCRVLAWHKKATDTCEVEFDLNNESDGTQKLFEFAGGWLRALDTGATLFVDELDRSLHPKLTRFLVERFNSRQNEKNAQLIFTTHDTSLLDPELLRRDQIWFTEKDDKRATRLYSLLDYSPRKDEALERGYLKGRYGALPVIGHWKW